MDGLLWLLVLGGFFYFMMRYGCGAHMVHGGHGDHGSHGRGEHQGHRPAEITSGQGKDPVCGMTVDPGQGYSEAYQGRAYQFCSRKCLDKFDADPVRYTS